MSKRLLQASQFCFLTCTVSVLHDIAPCSPCSAQVTSDSAGSASESDSEDDGSLLPDFPLDVTAAIKQDRQMNLFSAVGFPEGAPQLTQITVSC